MDDFEIEDFYSNYCLNCLLPLVDNNCINKICTGIFWDNFHKDFTNDELINHSKDVILSDLHPKLLHLCKLLTKECRNNDLNIIITQGYRSIEDQNKIYAQGRTSAGKIVTNAKGGSSLHNYRLAFDIAIINNGKVDWNDTASYIKVGLIGKKLGLTWGGNIKHGGDFKSIDDKPHFQYTDGHTLSYFQKGGTL